jgi:hypothetical protein
MHAWNVTCPTCGAGPGIPCRNAYGYPVSWYHDTRVDAARR